jgi:hypothetical protein
MERCLEMVEKKLERRASVVIERMDGTKERSKGEKRANRERVWQHPSFSNFLNLYHQK